jgi:hypothetical protein
MRRLDATMCGDCGHAWPRRARYCGRCGGSLVAPVVPGRTAVVRRRTPGMWLGGLLALALLGLLLTSLPADRSPAVADVTDPEVALPGPGELPARPVPGPDPAAPAASDTAVPLCEPEGCEVWRRTLDHPLDGLTLGAERLAYVQDATVVGLDPATGVLRWRRAIDPMVAAERAAATGSGPRTQLVAAGEVGVVVASSRGVELLAEEGRSRWAVPLELDGSLVDLLAADDVVLVVHELAERALWSRDAAGGEAPTSVVRSPPRLRLTALDVTDGAVRWARDLDAEAYALPDPGAPPDVVVARHGDRFAAVELTTGRTRFELPLPERDARPQLVGRYLVISGGPQGRMQVVATRDGSLLAERTGWPHLGVTVDGQLIVVVSSWSARASPRFEGVAIDPDGGVSWVRPLPVASGCCACCPNVLDLGAGRVRLVADPRREAVVVSTATGAELWRDPLRLDLAGAAAGEQWQLGPGLLATMQHDGGGGYSLVDRTGQRLDLRSGTWPVDGPAIGTRADGMVLLTSPTELAAVRFP